MLSLSTSPFLITPQWPWSGVFAQTDIGDHQDLGSFLFHEPNRLLHHTVVSVGSLPAPSLRSGMPKRITAGIPNALTSSHSRAARSTDNCATPGMDETG